MNHNNDQDNTGRFAELIRSQCKPLEQRATSLSPKLSVLPDVRAVLFDIYGTLVISGSGDIGSNRKDHQRDSFAAVAQALGLEGTVEPFAAIEQFETAIRAEHERLKATGVGHPEVDFREMWNEVLPSAIRDGGDVDVEHFTVDFELRVNPTWPMPGALQLLEGLRDRGLMLGIVSNAQFFTPILVEALLNRSLEELGFSSVLTYFSYEHRQAKPGTGLYELAAKQLEEIGISPTQALYVGNDMLNDVTAASRTGFQTALFAGDERSLRLRSDDDRVHGVEADIVLTDLLQLIECLPQPSDST